MIPPAPIVIIPSPPTAKIPLPSDTKIQSGPTEIIQLNYQTAHQKVQHIPGIPQYTVVTSSVTMPSLSHHFQYSTPVQHLVDQSRIIQHERPLPSCQSNIQTSQRQSSSSSVQMQHKKLNSAPTNTPTTTAVPSTRRNTYIVRTLLERSEENKLVKIVNGPVSSNQCMSRSSIPVQRPTALSRNDILDSSLRKQPSSSHQFLGNSSYNNTSPQISTVISPNTTPPNVILFKQSRLLVLLRSNGCKNMNYLIYHSSLKKTTTLRAVRHLLFMKFKRQLRCSSSP